MYRPQKQRVRFPPIGTSLLKIIGSLMVLDAGLPLITSLVPDVEVIGGTTSRARFYVSTRGASPTRNVSVPAEGLGEVLPATEVSEL